MEKIPQFKYQTFILHKETAEAFETLKLHDLKPHEKSAAGLLFKHEDSTEEASEKKVYNVALFPKIDEVEIDEEEGSTSDKKTATKKPQVTALFIRVITSDSFFIWRCQKESTRCYSGRENTYSTKKKIEEAKLFEIVKQKNTTQAPLQITFQLPQKFIDYANKNFPKGILDGYRKPYQATPEPPPPPPTSSNKKYYAFFALVLVTIAFVGYQRRASLIPCFQALKGKITAKFAKLPNSNFFLQKKG